ncbi:DUF4097 family beta strand repeat-containing protein [Rhodanobacter sp. L36]|uniref:DUF4097 family beta strand repeat-containing protein n=1 Tax=Rhodanobacter sp. L36 TaxID=1747221 RepID=UPI00131AA5B5|nr:DUF4097 family beta strand repeat-containing protein [Rhodanobacter sp. L36]
MRKSATLFLLLLLPVAASAEMPCKYPAARNANIDAAGLKSLVLTLGSSDLDIQSSPGLSRIEVRGTACASESKWLDDLQVNTQRSGDHATVDVKNDHDGMTISLFGSSYAYLKLQVRVPASIAVSIDSGSGDVNASNLAALDFDSGSGDLTADHISGALSLRLGSADAKVREVGSVHLHETGSGDVNIDGAHGDVRADESGSGDLVFRNIGGSVMVGETGSGDVTLDQVGHNVEVGSTGSGDIHADGVGGNFTVRNSDSGDVSYSDVKGKVTVPKKDDDDD